MKFLILILIFIQNISFAGWNEGELLYLNDFKISDSHGFIDGEQASLWGAIRSRRFFLVSLEKENILAPQSFKKALKLPLYKQHKIKRYKEPGSIVQQELRITQRRPLMVVIPGIFSLADDSQCRREYERFTRMHYHILCLPNPWATDYIAAQSKHKAGDIFAEAKSLLNLIRAAQEKIGKEYITETHIISFSYGAFLSALIANMESNLQDPSVNGSISLFGPPLHIGLAMQELDKRTKQDFDSYEQMDNLDYTQSIIQFFFAEQRSDIHDSLANNAKSITSIAGFHDVFIESFEQLDKYKKLNLYPRYSSRQYESYENYKTELKQWSKDFSFQQYFQSVAPELKDEIMSEKADLVYWVRRYSQSGRDQLRVLVANDDFLNAQYPIHTPKLNVKQKEVYVLPYGGHLGFMEFDFIELFLNTLYTLH